MPDPPDLAIERAIEFLRRRQLPHGEFSVLLGSDGQFSHAVHDPSVFGTAIVLHALMHLDRARVADMVDAAVSFLRSEMEFGGVWRYYSKRQHRLARLPPDVDDTACASDMLRSAGARVPRNTWAFLSSRNERGLFRTWIPPIRNSRWNPLVAFARFVGDCQARLRVRGVPVPAVEDPRFHVMHIDLDEIDQVVNANVVLYLGERPETLPAIEMLLRWATDGPPASPHYPDPLVFCYAVARAARRAAPRLAAAREPIVAYVTEFARRSDALTPLQAAWALCALLTFDAGSTVVTGLLRHIIDTQRDDGGWKAYAYYGRVFGSEELTTAACLEALAQSQ
ncbi:MAG TPA: hypothetical protein VHT53_13615 [Candidatus Elarobacter sp.]|nr:hypothetical protein [Candidatus Elarobacter sp.]